MTVSYFPADRRLAAVRRCAVQLLNLHGEHANSFWRAEMIRFVVEMRGTGADEDEIRRQAALFLQAVQAELEHSCHQQSSISG
ncbi:DUF6074 family protein [Neorhizobium alkalisoli]|uniref:DUF6074 family protein n=1 Tax=Neorhizobium alkalisoli TaxID=528178 RepID=UPI000CFA07A9|nr:DUF6074 family protein [Neorhizobium alkalisoli]